MIQRQYIYLIALLLAVSVWKTTIACSCMPQHPQTHFCQADFVIIATPKMMNHSIFRDENIYRLKIRNEFKMSEKARVALKSGRLYTPDGSSMCGVNMDLNRTYLISGRIINLQAHVNLCHYVKPWKDVNPRQRKGFKVLYKQGCACRIQYCSSPKMCNMQKSNHTCKWLHRFGSGPKCHSDYGICFLNKQGACHWAMARKLTQCLHSHSLTHDLKTIGH